MARSYIREARRRGLGTRRERIGPIVELLAQEHADAVVSRVFTSEDAVRLEEGLSASIARIRAGEFRPTPSTFACSGCPALDVVCAGPRLGTGGEGAVEPAYASAE